MGQQIKNIFGAGSGYGADYLSVLIDDKIYRMKVSEVLKFINNVKFKTTKKKTYVHLEVM